MADGRVTKRMIYATAFIAAVAIAISGYFAFLREPTSDDPVMQMMQQMHDTPRSQLYRTLFLAATTASAIVLGFLMSIYYLQGARESDEGWVSKEEKIELLAEDERAVLKAVMENPGIRQGEIVSLTGFSKAKASQLLAEIEGRGLIYREKQKKKYLVYPTSKVK